MKPMKNDAEQKDKLTKKDSKQNKERDGKRTRKKNYFFYKKSSNLGKCSISAKLKMKKTHQRVISENRRKI